ncbi:MAG: alpha-galactosidase, partial [Treponema sp.]|nr:alpha-galactosidase [Treponema sp.]
FGNVDYCRIGCDVSLSWDDNIFARMAHRERPSTKHTILNSIYRRQLNGRAFLNDPDVFILRSYNEKLGKERKSLLTKVNCLTGGLVFTSDNPNLMDEWQKETLNKALELRGAKITKVENDSGVVTITYNGEEKQMSGEIKFYQ